MIDEHGEQFRRKEGDNYDTIILIYNNTCMLLSQPLELPTTSSPGGKGC